MEWKSSYIVSDVEIELLKRMEGMSKKPGDPESYKGLSEEGLCMLCAMKDRSNDMFTRRYQGAKEVIDLIAKSVGIDPDDTSFWLYAPDIDGRSPIADRLDEWVSRSGEKAKLKRRVQELEQENSILRSLIQK